MATFYAELPKWLWILIVSPLCFVFGALTYGWYPKNRRQWRMFGLTTAGFAAFCVLMMCVLHRA